MNTECLIEYISIIIDLEKNKYAQEKTLKQLKKSFSAYNTEYNSNIKYITTTGDKIKNMTNIKNIEPDKTGFGWVCIAAYCFGCFGGAISCGLIPNKALWLFVYIAGAIICGSIPVLFWKSTENKRRKKAALQLERGIRKDLQVIENKKTRNSELVTAKNNINEVYSSFKKTYTITCNALKKYYDMNIIPPKYRSVVPVCMFYEYLSNGRTYSLRRNPSAFDEGAINIYEEECFKREILFKLDDVINNLQELRNEQQTLRRAIEDGNRKSQYLLDDISKGIQTSNSHLETIKYEEQQQSNCLRYLSYIESQRFYSE